MKILQITPAYYPAVAWGGPIVSVHLLNRELVNLGNEIVVITTTFGLEQNKTQENIIDGVKVIYLKSFKLGRWLIPYNLRFVIRDLLNKVDLAHIHQVWDPICWLSELYLIKKTVKRAKPFSRFIIAPRGSIDPILIKKKNYFIKKILYWLFIKKIFKHANGFHFTTEYEKKQFNKFTKNQFVNKQNEIIFNPLDISEFQKDVDKNLLKKWNLENKQYFLYLGRINWKKGIEFLINAFAKFTEFSKNYYLVVAGPDENNYQNKLEKLIKEKGISDNVIFTGLIKGDDKLCLLKNAKAFILPSLGENFGIAVAEALACGVPVIISKYVGLQNVIEKYNAGLIVNLDLSPHLNRCGDLCQKMKEIFLNENTCAELRFNGLKLVNEQFNPKNIASQVVNFYKTIQV